MFPPVLRLFSRWNSIHHASPELEVLTAIALKTLGYLEQHRLRVGISLLLVTLVAGYGATQMRVNNNVMEYFDESAALTRYAKILHERPSGMQTFSIVVSGEPDSFLKVQQLKTLQAIQTVIEDMGQFDSSYSLADFIGIVHSGTDSEKPMTPYLPQRDEVVREYSLMLDNKVLKPFPSRDFSQSRIIVRHNINASYELNQAVAELLRQVRQRLPAELSVQVTGEGYLNSQAVDYMADGQARSLALMLLVIFVLVSALFMQSKAGMIAVIANVFPIILLFGVMGYFDLALDTGTAMVGAIALGIVVDHSMHFMVRYQRAGKNPGNALQIAVRKESTPIIATAIALAMGFATLSLSEFPPVARFGKLSALVMLLALASTFLITPLLLWHSRLMSVWDVLSIKVRQQVMDDCMLFTGMRKWQVRKIIALSRLQEFRKDEAIFLQGQNAHYMRVLLEGTAEVWHTQVDGSTRQVGTLHAGDVFGTSALMRDRERISDVVAIKPVRALAVSWRDIHQIARLYPRISSRLLENLSLVLGDLLARQEAIRPMIKDELSGVYNATYIIDLLQFAADKANRYDEELSLLSLKVACNSTKGGHANWQDKAWIISKMAQSTRAVLRKGDMVSRWKDQIYWVILPNTNATQAHMLAQRVLQHYEQSDDPVKCHTEICVYITELAPGEDGKDLIDRATRQETLSEA